MFMNLLFLRNKRAAMKKGREDVSQSVVTTTARELLENKKFATFHNLLRGLPLLNHAPPNQRIIIRVGDSDNALRELRSDFNRAGLCAKGSI